MTAVITRTVRAAHDVVTGQGWLSYTPSAFRQAVLRNCSLEAHEAGSVLYSVGDPPGGLFGLVSGGLAISTAAEERGPYLAHFARPGTWFGEGSVISGQPRKVGLAVTRDAEILSLPLNAFRTIAQADPESWRFLSLVTLGHLDVAVGASDDLMIRDHFKRSVAVLLRLGGCRNAASPAPVPVEVDVTQEDLANIANIARTTAGAVLRELEKSGMVQLSYRHVRLLKPDAMRAMLK